MGACNFWRTNLPSWIVYAFAMQEHEDEENAIEYVKEILWKYFTEREEYFTNDRKSLWYIDVLVYDRDEKDWIYAKVYITIEYWYYEWARFDIDTSEMEDYDLSESSHKKIDKAVKRIENAFSKVCPIKLKKVGQFSNGEGVYEKA